MTLSASAIIYKQVKCYINNAILTVQILEGQMLEINAIYFSIKEEVI